MTGTLAACRQTEPHSLCSRSPLCTSDLLSDLHCPQTPATGMATEAYELRILPGETANTNNQDVGGGTTDVDTAISETEPATGSAEPCGAESIATTNDPVSPQAHVSSYVKRIFKSGATANLLALLGVIVVAYQIWVNHVMMKLAKWSAKNDALSNCLNLQVLEVTIIALSARSRLTCLPVRRFCAVHLLRERDRQRRDPAASEEP